ncbi:uncharacterized protein LOC135234876 isoform X3 [Anguilla rostrata]|uniref:uncharacterized protein LOC135234876 isoform X3 n=1 Tax=Anguilla rostrata TaxID=7938 RepID=UPI0030CF71E0
MELCQMAIKIEGDEPEKRAGVNVKEEEQESEINRRRPLILGRCQVSFDGGRRPSVFFDGDPARACDRLMAALSLIHVTCGEPGQSASGCLLVPGTPVPVPGLRGQLHPGSRPAQPSAPPRPPVSLHLSRLPPAPAEPWLSFWRIATPTYPSAIRCPHLQQPLPLKDLDRHCPRCFITFRDLQTSLQHMRLQHPALYDAQPTSPSLLPLPDRHKCPHCNFLFRDAKTKMRHMNVKDPTGCPLPPPLFFSTGDEEREEEEEVVMAVQVKEEDEGEHEEDDFSTALRHRGNLNPASPHQGEGKEGVVRVPIKPDAGDVRTKEETIEGVCECALCGKGFEQLLAAARQKAPWPAQGPLRPPGGPGPRLRALRAAVSQPGGAAAAPEAAHAGAALPLPETKQRSLPNLQALTGVNFPSLIPAWAQCGPAMCFLEARIAGTLLKGLRGSRGTEASTPRSSIVRPPPPNLLLSSRTDCLLPSHKSTRTVLLCGLQIQEELGEILHHNSCFPLESQHSTT